MNFVTFRKMYTAQPDSEYLIIQLESKSQIEEHLSPHIVKNITLSRDKAWRFIALTKRTKKIIMETFVVVLMKRQNEWTNGIIYAKN